MLFLVEPSEACISLTSHTDDDGGERNSLMDDSVWWTNDWLVVYWYLSTFNVDKYLARMKGIKQNIR